MALRLRIRQLFPADVGQHLGFFDARDLLHRGPTAALMQNVEHAVFTKHADWADENEYRLFVASGSLEDFYVPIGSGVIVGLVLGPCFDPANIGGGFVRKAFRNLDSCTRTLLGQRVPRPLPLKLL